MLELKVWTLELVSLALSPILHLTSCAALDQLLRLLSVKGKQNDISYCGSQRSKMVPTDSCFLVFMSLCSSLSHWRGWPV